MRPPSPAPSPSATPRPLHSRRAVDTLLLAGLQAHRQGQRLALSAARHPRLQAHLAQPWLSTVLGCVGDALSDPGRQAQAQDWLLAWGLSQLRPDRGSDLDGILPPWWLHSTAWRPLLAVAAFHGFLPVPAFPSHYRRRPDESVIDNLAGLWSVGPSTLYRYIDKGRRLLADVFLVAEPSGMALLGLRDAVHRQLCALQGQVPDADWHRRQARVAQSEERITDALWHLLRADDLDASLQLLHRHALQAAAHDEIDVIVARWESSRPEPALRFEFALAMAAVWRHRRDLHKESELLQRALRLAGELNQPLLFGRVYAAHGRLYELRDTDRSFACYDDSLAYLQQAISAVDEVARQAARTEYARVLIHLAWLHLRRNDPKAEPLLQQVGQLARDQPLPEEVIGELEQVWGEYWRCNSDLPKALEHKQRALNLFERLGDRRSTLLTYNNLSLIYGEIRQFERALHYGQRVLAEAQKAPVELEILAGAHGNLGVAHFYQGQLDEAIDAYGQSLALAERAGLTRHMATAHFNLAEACYRRFALRRDPADVRDGDRHAAEAARLGEAANQTALVLASRELKEQLLPESTALDRLVSGEVVAHGDEIAEIQRLRQSLALPQAMAIQVRTRLAIARSYLAIATREREAALSLAAAHGLSGQLDDALAELRSTFERSLSQEELRDDLWRQRAADLLDEGRRRRVLAHLHEQGAVNKSAYAGLAGLGLATASKHLGQLAERGLLVQTGKGPATRYLLPAQAP